jgi:hypothetical protein
MADAECAGGRCDSFGRCRAAGDLGIAYGGDFMPEGELSADLGFVDFAAIGEERTLRLRAVTGAVGPVRVVVPEPFEIDCGSGTFARECLATGVAEGSELSVRARVDAPGVPPAEAGQVQIYWGRRRIGLGIGARELVPLSGGELSGVYRGRLVRLENGAPGGAVVPVGVRIELDAPGGSTGDLAIDDPLRMLHPSGEWIGRITASGDAWRVDLPRFVAFEAAPSAADRFDVVADAADATLTVQVAGTLEMDLDVCYGERTAASCDGPRAAWRLSLDAPDLRAPDPMLTAQPDDTGPHPRPDAESALSWEAAIDARLSSYGASGPTAAQADAANAALAALAAGDASSVEACDRTGAVATAASDGYHSGSVMLGAPATMSSLVDAGPGRVVSIWQHVRNAYASVGGAAMIDALEVATSVSLPAGVSAIPCEWTSGTPSTFCTGTPAAASVSGGVCGAVAARFGCTVAPTASLMAGPLTIDVAVTTNGTSGACMGPRTGTVTLDATQVCVLPERPARCAELGLCAEPLASDTTRAGLAASLLGSALSGGATSASGDLGCAAGGRSAALDLENASDRGDTGSRLSVLSACAEELRRFREDPPPALGTAAGSAATLRQVLGEPACIDAARLVWALGRAGSPARRRAGDDRQADTLAHRLVQEWLAVHALLARDAASTVTLRQVLGSAPVCTGTADCPAQRLGRTIADLAAELEASAAGWDLLIHPRVGAVIAGLPIETLASPDYRVARDGSFTTDLVTDQPVGLPVMMIDTLTAQVGVLEELLRQAHLRGDATAPAEAAILMARLPPARALAEATARRAAIRRPTGIDPVVEPDWAPDYDRAVAALDAALDRVARRAEAMALGRNPLGIEEEDLALVFRDAPDAAMPAARFSAVSRTILDDNVMRSIAAARDAEGRARTSYAAFLERDYQERLDAAAMGDRLAGIADDYGGELTSLCGSPPGIDGEALFVDASWGPNGFDETDCFRRAEVAGCSVPDTAVTVTDDDADYQVCLRRYANGPGRALFADPATFTPAWRRLLTSAECDPTTTAGRANVTWDASATAFRCSGAGEAAFIADAPTARGDLGAARIDAVLREAETTCRAALPGARTAAPDPTEAAPALAEARCYRGSLGESSMAVRSAILDVRAAHADIEAQLAEHEIALRSCNIQDWAVTEGERIRDAIAGFEFRKRQAQFQMDIIGATVDAATECNNASTGSFWEDASGVGYSRAAFVCVAQAIKLISQIIGFSVVFDADNQIAALQDALDDVDNAAAAAICRNDARASLVGIAGARVALERAAQDLQAALLALANAQADARAAFDGGAAELAAARGRTVAPPAHDSWLDGDVADFVRDMATARRATYLAVRAVEHELQMDLPGEREAVLAASTADDLDDVSNTLRDLISVPGVGGRRPESFKVVVSLRDELLRLWDESRPTTADGAAVVPAPGWPTLAPTERFSAVLAELRERSFSDGAPDGAIRIPFRVFPLLRGSAFDPEGAAVFTTDTCAERLWSVNASIRTSGEDAFNGSETTFVPITLAQSTTFASQRCDGGVGDMAEASVRPSRNLFFDPTIRDPGTAIGADTHFVPASIDATFDVPRSEFDRDDYTNGASTEIAARGLYAEYYLEIPAEQIADPAIDGDRGLVLDRVEDILIRFDFVAVSR